MSAGTLREALDLGTRFVHLRQRDTGLLVGSRAKHLVLEARENHELGGLRSFFLEALMVGFYNMAGVLLGEPKPAGELWFDWPEPDYYARFRDRLPAVRFAMPSVQVRLLASYLDRRLIMPNASAVRNAVEQCEREHALSDPGRDNLLERVRAQLAPGPEGYADLERVAERLFMSARTLKRKLQERGTTFRALLDDARFRQAQHLLENPDLDIQQVAIALGYRDPACFTRAFRRWSGRTPTRRAPSARRASAEARRGTGAGGDRSRQRPRRRAARAHYDVDYHVEFVPREGVAAVTIAIAPHDGARARAALRMQPEPLQPGGAATGA